MAGLGNYINPGVGSWIDQRRNTLAGLGAGLLNGQPGAGVQAGIQADDAYATMQKAENERQANIAKAQAWMQQYFPQYAGLPADTGMEFAKTAEAAKLRGVEGGTDPASVQEYKFYANQELTAGRPPLSYAEWRKGANSTVRAGMGSPIWGKNRKNGEYMPFEPMSDGSIVSLTDPNAKPGDFLFDPGTVASDKAAGAGYGALQGPMQFNLPKAKQDVETELGHIDAVLGNKAGLEQSFGNVFGLNINGIGFPNQWTPTMPNTPKAGFQAQVEQVKGENFLAAYNTLRGAGAITEQEGIQAKSAMARLDTAQSKDDFMTALTELKAILQRGYDRMSSQASMGPYQSSGYAPPALGGQTYTYNPATGELE